MTMHDQVRVLDARAHGPTADEWVVDWSLSNPGAWIWAADSHTGTSLAADHLPWSTEARLAAIHAWRACAHRRGVELRLLVGFRFDVLQPRSGVGAPDVELRPEWVLGSPDVMAASAVDAWRAAGWTVRYDGHEDWWRQVLIVRPGALLYCQRDGAQRLVVVGAVADFRLTAYRDWMIPYAMQTLRTFYCDGLMVGVKPWEREGSAYLMPAAPGVSSNLIQPPCLSGGVWAAAVSGCLSDLAMVAEIPVMTLTRPPAAPQTIGIGGTAVQAVTGEAALVMS